MVSLSYHSVAFPFGCDKRFPASSALSLHDKKSVCRLLVPLCGFLCVNVYLGTYRTMVYPSKKRGSNRRGRKRGRRGRRNGSNPPTEESPVEGSRSEAQPGQEFSHRAGTDGLYIPSSASMVYNDGSQEGDMKAAKLSKEKLPIKSREGPLMSMLRRIVGMLKLDLLF